jgi:hypothetical protein
MAWFVIDNTDTVHFSLTDRTDENDVLWIRLQAHFPAKFSKLEMRIIYSWIYFPIRPISLFFPGMKRNSDTR